MCCRFHTRQRSETGAPWHYDPVVAGLEVAFVALARSHTAIVPFLALRCLHRHRSRRGGLSLPKTSSLLNQSRVKQLTFSPAPPPASFAIQEPLTAPICAGHRASSSAQAESRNHFWSRRLVTIGAEGLLRRASSLREAAVAGSTTIQNDQGAAITAAPWSSGRRDLNPRPLDPQSSTLNQAAPRPDTNTHIAIAYPEVHSPPGRAKYQKAKPFLRERL